MSHPLFAFDSGSGARGGALGQDARLIHLAVANGFPPGSYRPLAAALAARYRVFSLPPRALWPEAATLAKPAAWSVLADDLLAGLQMYGLAGVIGVGHSFGAIATLMAAVNAPERFTALCLLDPTILPAHALDLIAQAQARGMADQLPLARGARRRRTEFASQQEAFAHWRARRVFQDWPDDALWAYIASQLQPALQGDGFELVWPPEWEAHYYETIDTDPWPVVERLAALDLPVLVIRGEETDTFTEEPAARLQALLPRAAFHVLPGYGHLFPLAAPQATASLIATWLDRIGR